MILHIEQPEPRKRPGLFYVVRLSKSGTHGEVVATVNNSNDPKWALHRVSCEFWRRLMIDTNTNQR